MLSHQTAWTQTGLKLHRTTSDPAMITMATARTTNSVTSDPASTSPQYEVDTRFEEP